MPHGFAHEQLQQTCCAGHGDERHLAILTMPIFSDSIGTTSTSIVPIFVALQGLETVRNTRQTAFVVKSSSCMALGRFFPFFFSSKGVDVVILKTGRVERGPSAMENKDPGSARKAASNINLKRAGFGVSVLPAAGCRQLPSPAGPDRAAGVAGGVY